MTWSQIPWYCHELLGGMVAAIILSAISGCRSRATLREMDRMGDIEPRPTEPREGEQL
jgi:hypothetical protein